MEDGGRKAEGRAQSKVEGAGVKVEKKAGGKAEDKH